jgi:hypothetical protein
MLANETGSYYRDFAKVGKMRADRLCYLIPDRELGADQIDL